MSLKRSDLVDVADELNKELGLDPAIDTKKKVKDLKDLIIEVGEIVDQDEDEFSDLTWRTLEYLQVLDRSGESSDKKQEGAESAERDSQEAKEKQSTDQTQRKTKTQKEIEFLTFLINKGKYTRAQLLDLTLKQFSDASESKIYRMLVGAKNPKYNKFERLVVEDKNKIMKFKS